MTLVKSSENDVLEIHLRSGLHMWVSWMGAKSNLGRISRMSRRMFQYLTDQTGYQERFLLPSFGEQW